MKQFMWKECWVVEDQRTSPGCWSQILGASLIVLVPTSNVEQHDLKRLLSEMKEFGWFLLYSFKISFVFLIFLKECCCLFLPSGRRSVDKGILVASVGGVQGRKGCAGTRGQKNEMTMRSDYRCCPPMKSARAPIFQLSPNFSTVRLQL